MAIRFTDRDDHLVIDPKLLDDVFSMNWAIFITFFPVALPPKEPWPPFMAAVTAEITSRVDGGDNGDNG